MTAKDDQIAEFNTPGSSSELGEGVDLGDFPSLPDTVKRRFPEIVEWENKVKDLWDRAKVQISGPSING